MNRKRSKGYTLVELLLMVGIIAILIAVCVGVGGGGCSVSSGTRVGTINKFSTKGIVHNSHEGELIMGVAHGPAANGSVGNVWEFSVMDDAVVNEVENAMDAGKVVKLTYKQTLWHNPFSRDTNYIVTGVNYIDPPK